MADRRIMKHPRFLALIISFFRMHERFPAKLRQANFLYIRSLPCGPGGTTQALMRSHSGSFVVRSLWITASARAIHTTLQLSVKATVTIPRSDDSSPSFAFDGFVQFDGFFYKFEKFMTFGRTGQHLVRLTKIMWC